MIWLIRVILISAIITAIAWPAVLISAANVIDNPWGVCLQRSIATGKELAETLLAREQVHICRVKWISQSEFEDLVFDIFIFLPNTA